MNDEQAHGFAPSPFEGEGWGRSGGFEPQASSPLGDAGLQASKRAASEGEMLAKKRLGPHAFTLTPALSLLGRGSNTMRLPSPGLAFGDYPQRQPDDDMAGWLALARTVASRLGARRAPRLSAATLAAYRSALVGLGTMAALSPAAGQVRGRLRREGLSDTASGQALAVAALVMQRTQGLMPYDTQVLAAWLMLKGHLVEMATGEGKTVAAALAAAVAALAGTPVHVLTANEYLVQRDQQTLAPFYAALGLQSACVTAALSGPERSAAWRADVVYTTASQLAFDYLRDHLALGGERDARVLRAQAMAAEVIAAAAAGTAVGDPASATTPQAMLPGLCLCLVDEADSILLDEAVVPLILAAPAGRLDTAAYRRAYELASGLQRQRDYLLQVAEHRATLTPAGRERINAAVAGARGELQPARRACELVEAALAARLLYRRDREYAVVNGELLLIDELTGRVATGRQWQGALHPMVQIKETLEPSPPTCTAAQITYQRFFPRYLHLAGMSGTLLEARHELRLLYGAPVQPVPLAKPNRRRWLGQRCYTTTAAKWQAVLHTVQALSAAGRPVLVGTDSVADSAQLSALLLSAAVPHQVLNATQDGAEADKIARAGQAGCVTVATNMAGRGTDIRLDAAASAAGGLHVLATMRNRARRIDRQLMGRAARHGDPGSAEVVVALDDALLQRHWPAPVLRALHTLASLLPAPRAQPVRTRIDPFGLSLSKPRDRSKALPSTGSGVLEVEAPCKRGGVKSPSPKAGLVSPLLAGPLFAVTQSLAEWRDREHRRELRHSDEQAVEMYGFSGGTE